MSDCRTLSLSIADQKHVAKLTKSRFFPLPIHPAMYDAAIDQSPPGESRTFAARRASPYETQQKQYHWNRIDRMLDVF